MAYIQRANVILSVKDSEVDYYLGLGYNEVTKDGKVLKETPPTDIRTLQKMFNDSRIKIAELESENSQLKEELAKFKAKKSETKQADKSEDDETKVVKKRNLK